MDFLLLVPPFSGSTRTDFDFTNDSRALKDSSSVFAPRKRDRVVDTHRLQCLRNNGGISDVILNSSWFAFLISAMIEMRATLERVLLGSGSKFSFPRAAFLAPTAAVSTNV